jgi:diketogulonate reductase-like aldo/keto reductase
LYGAGEAERIVGEAIWDRCEDVFLVLKVLPSHASRKVTIAACEGSLARLGTDHLDCYFLHWRGQHTLEETIEAFEEKGERGRFSRGGAQLRYSRPRAGLGGRWEGADGVQPGPL